MTRMLFATLFILLVLVALIAVLYALRPQKMPSAPAVEGISADASSALLAVSLPDADGAEYTLSQWNDTILVVNFWATWCPPCVKEIPEFASASRHYAEQPVQFVGLSIDSAENVRSFRERFDVPYPLLVGATDTLQLATEFGNAARALPFTVILDRDGSVSDVKLGMLTERDLKSRIDALLAR